MHRHRPLPAALAVLLVAASACSESEAKEGGSRTFRLAINEPAAIDPYNARENEGLLVVRQLFEGLVTLGPVTGELQPGVAETWSSDESCSHWTFRLRRGSTFSTGEEVTAESFSRGMTRAAKPSAASDTASFMAGIDGYVASTAAARRGSRRRQARSRGWQRPTRTRWW